MGVYEIRDEPVENETGRKGNDPGTGGRGGRGVTAGDLPILVPSSTKWVRLATGWVSDRKYLHQTDR